MCVRECMCGQVYVRKHVIVSVSYTCMYVPMSVCVFIYVCEGVSVCMRACARARARVCVRA